MSYRKESHSRITLDQVLMRQ